MTESKFLGYQSKVIDCVDVTIEEAREIENTRMSTNRDRGRSVIGGGGGVFIYSGSQTVKTINFKRN